MDIQLALCEATFRVADADTCNSATVTTVKRLELISRRVPKQMFISIKIKFERKSVCVYQYWYTNKLKKKKEQKAGEEKKRRKKKKEEGEEEGRVGDGGEGEGAEW